MRVYGKRSSSLAIYGTTSDESLLELSDEDDNNSGKHEGQQTVNTAEHIEDSSPAQIESDNLGYSREETSRLSNNSERLFSNASASSIGQGLLGDDVSNLKAFDFLDNHAEVKKRRRTNYERRRSQDIETSEHIPSQSPIYRTVSDLNKFLASLESANDNAIQKTFEKELNKSVKEEKKECESRVTYGRSRTMLQAKDDEINEAAEEEDQEAHDGMHDCESKLDDEDASTHHYNELKNMGEILKYQDELEFLTDSSSVHLDRNSFTSRLLNLALTIEQDKEFLRYVNKYCAIEVCNWFFTKKLMTDETILLLQGFLLDKIQLPWESLPHFFEQFIVTLMSADQLPQASLLSSKMTRLNYGDFLKRTGQTTGQIYSLRLCVKFRDIMSSKIVARRLFRLFHQQLRATKVEHLFFDLIEAAFTFDSTVLYDLPQTVSLFRDLTSFLPEQSYNESLIKSLILLTNEERLLLELQVGEKENLFHHSLEVILRNIHPPKRDATDLIILHLGLSLNLIGLHDSWQVEQSQLKQAQDLLLRVNADPEQNQFIKYMYHLNLAHMVRHSGTQLTQDSKELVINTLKAFDKETQGCNEAICDKINIALLTLL